MTIKRFSGKSLLLLELSIILVFFLVGSIVCINLFVKANDMSEDSRLLNEAVVETTSIAETLKGTNSSMEKTAQHLAPSDAYVLEDDTLTIYYDSSMNPVAPNSSSYIATINKEKDGKLRNYVITITSKSDGSSIYTLSFSTIRRGGK